MIQITSGNEAEEMALSLLIAKTLEEQGYRIFTKIIPDDVDAQTLNRLKEEGFPILIERRI